MRKASPRFLRIFAAEIVLATLATSAILAQEPTQTKSSLKDKIALQLIVVPSLREAQGVIQELKNGADFGQVAKRESIDPTAETGNVIGAQSLSVLRPELRAALQKIGPGQFTAPVEVPLGLAYPVTSSQAAVWADVNNDGFLDLFIVNETGRAQLFLNNGDGTFKDIATAAGVAGDGTQFSKGVAAADYDNDGYVDFYVCNLNGVNFLYHNNHDDTFTEVASKAGVPGSGRGSLRGFSTTTTMACQIFLPPAISNRSTRP
jgi:hypothetical protein